MTDDFEEIDPDMPLCPECGQPMQLKDIRELVAQQLGIVYEEKDAPYQIICCGRRLSIRDEANRQKAIRLLKEYHGIE